MGVLIRSNPKHWGKFPQDVARDKRLGEDHLRIYAIMATSVQRGETCSKIGQRLIGSLLEMSAMTVCRRQAELVEWELITPMERRNGQRGWFQMVSPAFSAAKKTGRAGFRAQPTAITATVSAARAVARIMQERALA